MLSATGLADLHRANGSYLASVWSPRSGYITSLDHEVSANVRANIVQELPLVWVSEAHLSKQHANQDRQR